LIITRKKTCFETVLHLSPADGAKLLAAAEHVRNELKQPNADENLKKDFNEGAPAVKQLLQSLEIMKLPDDEFRISVSMGDYLFLPRIEQPREKPDQPQEQFDEMVEWVRGQDLVIEAKFDLEGIISRFRQGTGR